MVEIIRMAEGPDWLPRRLEVEASAKDWAGKRPEFAGEALIEFDAKRTGIELPSSSLDRRLHRTGSDLAADLHSDSPESPAVDLKGSLQQALRSIACEQQLTLELGAEISCVSERSLQRILSGEGTSWREIVDRVHFETALDLMSERTHSLADIAAILGYSQYPHFYRAFQRWTGESPSAYMKRLAP
jgi:AraC-like DNA-binding protein